MCKVFRALSDADEANFVANNIWEQHNANQRKFTDFAILYRTNSQTRAFEDALRRKNIPYRVYGGLSFYQEKKLRIWCVFKTFGQWKWQRSFAKSHHRYYRDWETTQNKLIVFADSQNVSLANVLDNLGIYAPHLGFNNGVISKLADFWSMIKAFQVMLKKWIKLKKENR